MKKIFKLLILPLLITAAFYLIILAVMSIGNNKISINVYHADVIFSEQGDMVVTETFDMTYKQALRVRFRDIDYVKFYDDYPFEYAFNNTASFETDQSYMRVYKNGIDVSNRVDFGYSWLGDRDELGQRITCEPQRSGCVSMFADLKNIGGLEGDITFEYHYVISGVATRYDDISEINWNLFDYMESGIKEGSVRITLPEKDLSLDNFYIFTHGIKDANAEYLSDHEALITFNDSDKKDFLEFRLLVPNRLFSDMRDQNIDDVNQVNKNIILTYENDLIDTQAKGEIQQIISWIVACLTGIILYLATFYFYRKFFKPYTTDFNEPYLRDVPYDITPAEMSYIYFNRQTSDEDVTATLLDLIRKKYIKIEYDPTEISNYNPNFKLILLKRPSSNELKPHEIHLIKWFFDTIGKENEVNIRTIENYPINSYSNSIRFKHDADIFKEKVKSAFKVNPFMYLIRERKIAKSVLLLSVIAFFYIIINAGIYGFNSFYQLLLLLCFSIFYFYDLKTYMKRKREYQEQYVRWEAFRRFLVDFGTFDDDPITNVIIWEKYLVYATSFKIADLVMEQLRVSIETNGLNENGQTFIFMGNDRKTHYNPMRSFDRSFRHMKSQAANQIRIHNREMSMINAKARSRSSSGFRGGFGGGSSFGGGGGGGRSR
ncbi:DUF2207 domain-containing protein [Mariniplasma anaerobium]|uniref:DUF2207 domain-containing protein n=1 Tax=Mariniplasma anaerobium TaxID=2735436 RepID=A0A7U9XWD4_9MOLU|nr:DUF2207 domain-containing protein [Mariniplasma anaerobium]BCR36040.1 hypothetical protein MPAN_009330 [Mariniplasma anaerobium]